MKKRIACRRLCVVCVTKFAHTPLGSYGNNITAVVMWAGLMLTCPVAAA